MKKENIIKKLFNNIVDWADFVLSDLETLGRHIIGIIFSIGVIFISNEVQKYPFEGLGLTPSIINALFSGIKIAGVVLLVIFVTPIIIYFSTCLLDNFLEKIAKRGGK